LIEQGLPISHITTGQEVPEDIVCASAGAIVANAFSLDRETAKRLL